jgi:hypothetical protein
VKLICLCEVSLLIFAVDLFTFRKILRREATGFTSPPKEAVRLIFIALNIHRLCRVLAHKPWVQWQER